MAELSFTCRAAQERTTAQRIKLRELDVELAKLRPALQEAVREALHRFTVETDEAVRRYVSDVQSAVERIVTKGDQG
jgi:hypothetical protein